MTTCSSRRALNRDDRFSSVCQTICRTATTQRHVPALAQQVMHPHQQLAAADSRPPATQKRELRIHWPQSPSAARQKAEAVSLAVPALQVVCWSFHEFKETDIQGLP